MNLEPGAGDQNAQHRFQAREAESVISGIVRKIIHVMLAIVALLIIWQFLGWL